MRLKEIRKKRGLTQAALAEMIGVNISTISRYEKGQLSPTVSVIRKLAKALNVDYYTLIEDVPVATRPEYSSISKEGQAVDVTITFSEQESNLIEDFAKLHGINTSTYIRNIVMERIEIETDTLTCINRVKDAELTDGPLR